MRKKGLLLLAIFLAAASAMAAQDVRYNFDKTQDFSRFKTYKWVHINNGAKTLNSLVVKQVMAAVDSQLAAKGLTKTDTDPDLYVGYQAAIGQETQFSSYNTDWGYGPGWYRGGWYGGNTYGETSTIHTGQLAIDMYDPKDHSLVWRGVVSKTLDEKAKPEKQEKNLNKAVAKLFKDYPPKPKE
jgi:hypothetical protein